MHDVPMIDCAVHHEPASDAELIGYLTREWREYVESPGAGRSLPLTTPRSYVAPHAQPAEATAPEDVISAHVEAHGIERAILAFGSLVQVSGLPNPHLAAEIARAANDWLAEAWLSADDRLYGSVLIANQLPEVAAAEIRRAGANPKVVQIVMSGNGVGHPWGHPLYHPIYEAAAELDLPVALRGGAEGGVNPTPTAGGASTFSLEHETLASQGMMTGLASIVAGGVFEKYPGVRFIFDGGGVGWIPAFLWRYDASWKGVRREIPWARRLPTDYFREHIFVTTGSLEVGPDPAILGGALETIGGEQRLVFASDYPQQSGADAIARTSQGLPPQWLEKAFHENPLRGFRWPSPATSTHGIPEEGSRHV